MRKFPIIALLMTLAMAAVTSSCSLDDDNDYGLKGEQAKWFEDNVNYYLDARSLKNPDGTAYYKEINPVWDPTATVLIHWYNDTLLTRGNLVPLQTSTVDVKYRLTNIKGEPMDSSYLQTAWGDSIFRTKVTGVIDGWQIALQSIHAGDSIRLVVPYTEGYGTSKSGKIPAYSTLVFDMKLVDIPYYEIKR